ARCNVYLLFHRKIQRPVVIESDRILRYLWPEAVLLPHREPERLPAAVRVFSIKVSQQLIGRYSVVQARRSGVPYPLRLLHLFGVFAERAAAPAGGSL